MHGNSGYKSLNREYPIPEIPVINPGIILTWVDFPVNRRSVPSWDIKRNSMRQRGKKKDNVDKKYY